MAATYDPSNIIVTFAGIPLTGFADGTFLSAERAEDTWTTTVGAGGEVARTRNRNASGTVTFTALQTSLVNDLLSALMELDELTGAGVAPFFAKDLGGLSTVLSANAWIKRPPTQEFGKELASREWMIECEQLLMFAGGSVV